MKKKVCITVFILLLIVGTYQLITSLKPSVSVINNSSQTILNVTCYLPNSKIVMDSLQIGETTKILYSLKQNKGILKYRITFNDGTNIIGSCDSIKNYDFFNRIQIEVNKSNKATCIK
mgnify:CR=1 FL=1